MNIANSSRMATVAAAVASLVVPSDAPAQQQGELGEPTAVHPEPFSMIAGLRELSDGRVFVADALDESLFVLDSGLRGRETIGRKGQGPEEYRQPDALFALPGDSTLMTDLGNGRLTVVAPDGSFGRTIPMSQDRDGRLLILIPEGVDQQRNLYFQPRGDGVLRDSAVVVRWTPSGGAPDTVATIKLRDVTESSSGPANERQTRVFPVPLSPEDGWAIAPDGRLAVVRTSDYSVEWTGPDGRRVRGPANPYEPVPIRTADKEEWVAEASGGVMMMVTNENGQVRATMRRGGMGNRMPGIDRFSWPDAKPPFDADDVWVAPDGMLWVRRHVPAGRPVLFDLFGADGSRRASVTLPPGRRLIGFGAGSVYLARNDALDFQWLERYDRPVP